MRQVAAGGGLAAEVVGCLDLDRVVDLVRRVCRIPSVLGEEGELAGFLASVMAESGFEGAGLQPVASGRPNAVGEVCFGAGPRVVLTGHLDTKPVSRGWSVAAPFSGDVVGAAVYGHGVMDMKAALACQLAAVEAVRECGLRLAGTAAVAAVSDHMGAQSGSAAYFDAYGADLCVLGELTGNRVCLGHRGRYYFDVHVLGRSAHSCHKHAAVNANVLAARAILALDASRLMPELPAGVARLFGAETFIVPGRVYGGLPPGGPSMIPDECVIRVDCRPQPGVSTAVVRAEIDRCLQQAAAADPRFAAEVVLADVKSGYLARPGDRVVRLMAEAVRLVRGGGEVELVAEGWLGDTASFGDKVPTVIFGPGGPPVYCADEHLAIADIHEAAKVYAVFTALALSSPGEDTGPDRDADAAPGPGPGPGPGAAAALAAGPRTVAAAGPAVGTPASADPAAGPAAAPG
jgi:acetylornithine deacetylase